MPILETDVPFEELKKLAEKNTCKDCGANLVLCWGGSFGYDCHIVRCSKDVNHEGLEREAYLSPYSIPGFNLFNLNKGREIMENEHGEEKTKALAKYISTGAITKRIATEIVETLWGGAPVIEKTKCILLCQTYQLNPLMKHIYLVGYKRKENGKVVVDQAGVPILDWSIQIGIGATRLMAQRKHNYSYLDMTPRKATHMEIDKILGDTADPGCVYGFVHIKDVDTGAEAFGLRGIEKNASIKGTEKGNTHLNMACVRAERLALDRQYPGEMPQDVEVVDERYIEADYRVVDEDTGEITEHIAEEPESQPKQHWCEEHNCAFVLKTGKFGQFYAHKKAEGGWCNEKKKESVPSAPMDEAVSETTEPELEPEPSKELAGFIDKYWLEESLKTLQDKGLKGWTESNLLSYIKHTYEVEAETVIDAVAKLDRGKAAHLVKRIQETLEMA